MKMLTVYVPETIHRIMKLYCVKNGFSMTRYIIGLIEDDLKLMGELK